MIAGLQPYLTWTSREATEWFAEAKNYSHWQWLWNWHVLGLLLREVAAAINLSGSFWPADVPDHRQRWGSRQVRGSGLEESDDAMPNALSTAFQFLHHLFVHRSVSSCVASTWIRCSCSQFTFLPFAIFPPPPSPPPSEHVTITTNLNLLSAPLFSCLKPFPWIDRIGCLETNKLKNIV